MTAPTDDDALIRRLRQIAHSDEPGDDDIERDCEQAARRLSELRDERYTARMVADDFISRAGAAEAREAKLRKRLQWWMDEHGCCENVEDRALAAPQQEQT